MLLMTHESFVLEYMPKLCFFCEKNVLDYVNRITSMLYNKRAINLYYIYLYKVCVENGEMEGLQMMSGKRNIWKKIKKGIVIVLVMAIFFTSIDYNSLVSFAAKNEGVNTSEEGTLVLDSLGAESNETNTNEKESPELEDIQEETSQGSTEQENKQETVESSTEGGASQEESTGEEPSQEGTAEVESTQEESAEESSQEEPSEEESIQEESIEESSQEESLEEAFSQEETTEEETTDTDEFKVTYRVTPKETASVHAPGSVESGNTLIFTVEAEKGYYITSVTANGESLTADADSQKYADAVRYQNQEDSIVAATYSVNKVWDDILIHVNTQPMEAVDMMEIITLSTAVDGLKVIIEGTRKALNGAVSIKAKPYSIDKVQQAIDKSDAVEEDVTVCFVYDITLHDKKGQEIQPTEKVTVRFEEVTALDTVNEDTADALQIFTINDSLDTIESFETFAEGEDAVIETAHFTLYGGYYQTALYDLTEPISIEGHLQWAETDASWSSFTRPSNSNGISLIITVNGVSYTSQTIDADAPCYMYGWSGTVTDRWTYTVTNVPKPVKDSQVTIGFQMDAAAWPYTYHAAEISQAYQDSSRDLLEIVSDFQADYNTKTLTIDQTVLGSSTGADFSYTVELTGNNGQKKMESISVSGTASGSIVLPAGLQYKITANTLDGFTAIHKSDSDGESGRLNKDVTAVGYTRASVQDEVFLKVWLDNNNSHGIRKDIALELYYTKEGTSTPVLVTADTLGPLGLSSVPVPVKRENSYSQHSYTFPKLPSVTTEGIPVTYSVKEKSDNAITENYIVSYGDDGKTITNTERADFQVSMEWKDAFSKGNTRPDMVTIEIHNAGSAGTDTVVLTERIPVTGDSQIITVNTLPEYDTDGNPLIYYALIKECVSKDTDLASYVTTYDNGTGSYGNITERVYEGGTIINTAQKNVSISGTKLWLDNHESTPSNRPDGILTLWRYTKTGNNTWINASPVTKTPGGSDLVTLAISKMDNVFNFSFGVDNNGTPFLPKYDTEGNEYVYLVKETLSGSNADTYTQIYNNTDAKEDSLKNNTNALFDGGTLTNLNQQTLRIGIRKTWITKASQGTLKDITLQLSLMKQNEDGTQSVAKTITGSDAVAEYKGFSDATLSQIVYFDVNKFDPDTGKTILYSAKENFIKKNGIDVPITNNRFLLEDVEYEIIVDGFVESQDGSGGTIDVTNKMNDRIDYIIEKRWAGESDADIAVRPETVSYQLHAQNYKGETVSSLEIGGRNVTFPYSGTLTKRNAVDVGNLVWIDDTTFKKRAGSDNSLPKYDEQGYEYTYYVTETTMPGYILRITYDYEEKTASQLAKTTAIMTNTKTQPGGDSITLKASKKWLDDGDSMHRLPVTAAVAVRKKDTKIITKDYGNALSFSLNATNGWQDEITFDGSKYPLVEDGSGVSEDDYEYYVYEKGVGTIGGDVLDKDGNSTSETLGEVYYSGISGDTRTSGYVTTRHHKYETEITGSNGVFVFTNKRIGEIQVLIHKEWIDGGRNAAERPAVQFTVWKEEGGITSEAAKFDSSVSNNAGWSVTAADSSNSKYEYESPSLSKYDDEGAVIAYSVTEKMKSAAEADFAEGVVDNYTSVITEGSYINGKYYNTNDIFPVDILNQRSAITSFQVYKVWKDYDASLRSDIYLDLYYKIGNDGTLQPMPGSHRERIWSPPVQSTDNYTWKCTIENLPQFVTENEIYGDAPLTKDAGDLGKEIFYYVQEEMLVRGKYKTTYYENSSQYESKIPLPADTADENKGFAPNEGYILNRLEENMTITGTKVWLNIPNGTTVDELPDPASITLKLMRKLESQGDAAPGDTGFSTTLNADRSSYGFYEPGSGSLKSFPQFDEEGQKYIYSIQEDFGNNAGVEIAYPSGKVVQTNFALKNYYNSDGENNQRSIKVSKQWEVTALDGTAVVYPKLRFILYQYASGDNIDLNNLNSAKKLQTIVLPSSGTPAGEYIFTNIPVYGIDGKQYKYVIAEEKIPGYDIQAGIGTSLRGINAVEVPPAVPSGNSYEMASVNFKNTYHTEEITIEGKKYWDDYGVSYNSRPELADLTIQIIATADTITKTYTQGVDFDVTWTTEDDFTGAFSIYNAGAAAKKTFPMYASNGIPYTYKIIEEQPGSGNSYGAYNNGSAISVSLSAEKADNDILYFQDNSGLTNVFGTSYTVKKVWDDDGDSYGLRLPDITIALEWSNDGGTSWNAFKDGSPLPGSLTVEQYDTKLKSLSGTAKGTYPIIINANNNWQFTFNRLPSKDNVGNPILYRAIETKIGTVDVVPDSSDASNNTWQAGSYKITYNHKSSEHISTVTNTIVPTSLTVKKVWKDNNNLYSIRPASLTVYLQRKLANDAASAYAYVEKTTGGYVSLSLSGAGNEWSKVFQRLPKYDIAGQEYVYTVTEIPPDTLKDSANTDLTTAGGSYTAELEHNPSTATVTLKNTLTEMRTLTVQKIWEDSDVMSSCYKRPSSVQVELLHDGQSYVPKKTVTLHNAADGSGGSYTFNDLPVYNPNTVDASGKISKGTAIVYSVQEITQGYDVEYKYYTASGTSPQLDVDADTRRIEITNRPPTRNITVSKVWKDENDLDNIRPASVEVTLYQNGVKVDGSSQMLRASNSWKCTYENLPVSYVDAAANKVQPYQYSVVETGAGADETTLGTGSLGLYTTSYDTSLLDSQGLITITNSHDTKKVTLHITKAWLKDTEYDIAKQGRPADITIQLQESLDNGATFQDVAGKTLQLKASDMPAWEGSFSMLPAYKLGADGKSRLVRYRVRETSILANYTEESTISKAELPDNYIYEITLTNTMKTVAHTVTKVWKHDDKYRDYRNDIQEILVLLQAKTPSSTWSDKNITGVIKVTNGNAETITFDNLPYCDANGEQYMYRAIETGIFYKPRGQANGIPIDVNYDGAGTGLEDVTKGSVSIYHYTAAANGNQTVLTNSLDTGDLLVQKRRDLLDSLDANRDTAFGFTVTIKKDRKEIPYTGDYAVYKIPDSGSQPIGLPVRTEQTGPEGIIRIKAGEMFLIKDLPSAKTGYTYQVTELSEDNGFKQTSHQIGGINDQITSGGILQSTIDDSTLTTDIFTNTPVTQLAIDNITSNPGKHNTGMTDIGGMVGVITSTKKEPHDYDVDGYKEDMLAVSWTPEENWQLGSTFVVEYYKFADNVKQSIKIDGYMNTDGTLKPMTDSVYAPLLKQFPNADIKMSASSSGQPVIVLTLAKTPEEMTRKVLVKVHFQPTIAIENTTKGDAGGKVSVESGVPGTVSDGVVSKDGYERYNQLTVSGQSEEGYCIDLKNITIGSPFSSSGDVGSNSNAYILSLKEDGSFLADVTAVLGGKQIIVPIKGNAKIQYDAKGYPISIVLTLSDSTVCLDFGIPFVLIQPEDTDTSIPDNGSNSGDNSHNGGTGGNGNNHSNNGTSSSGSGNHTPAVIPEDTTLESGEVIEKTMDNIAEWWEGPIYDEEGNPVTWDYEGAVYDEFGNKIREEVLGARNRRMGGESKDGNIQGNRLYPKTNDARPLMPYVMLMLFSLVCIILLLARSRGLYLMGLTDAEANDEANHDRSCSYSSSACHSPCVHASEHAVDEEERVREDDVVIAVVKEGNIIEPDIKEFKL